MTCQLRPTGKSGLSSNCRLCIRQAKLHLLHLLHAQAVYGGQMVQNRQDRFRVTCFKQGEEGFSLAAEMIEIGTLREILDHDKFSMLIAWIRKQAARRTCSQF